MAPDIWAVSNPNARSTNLVAVGRKARLSCGSRTCSRLETSLSSGCFPNGKVEWELVLELSVALIMGGRFWAMNGNGCHSVYL